MNTMNMPGFSAQESLYISKTTASHNYQKHHPNSGLLLQRNVVPQAPIFLGETCGRCNPQNVWQVKTGSGMMECCDFYCDPPKGICYKQGCTSSACSNAPWGGGMHTGGGGFDAGGGVFNTGGGVFTQ